MHMSDIIDSIRESNISFVNNSNFKGIKKLIVDNYNDSAHFVYELLQNADDAGATKIRFEVDEQMLTVIHNGKPFDKKDVVAICSISLGTKSDDYTKIGRFGIGFKSVFVYTTCPEIHSGEYHFKIEDLVLPQHVKKTSDQKRVEDTVFYIPLDVKTKQEASYRQIERKFDEMCEESILFLSNIESIELSSRTGLKTITKESSNNKEISKDTYVQNVTIKVDNHNYLDGDLNNIEFKIFSKKNIELQDYNDDGDQITIKNQKCSIAYCLDEDEEELLTPDSAGLNTNFFVFFPTMIANTFPLLIHAPFKTKFSRDTFSLDCDANIQLKNEVGKLIANSIPMLCKDKLMNPNILDAIFEPFNDRLILESVKKHTIELLNNGSKIIRTIDDKYTTISKAVFTSEDKNICNSMKKIIDVEWLTDYFNCDYDYSFCKADEYSTFYNFINENFDDTTYIDRNTLLENFDADYISAQDDEWLISFINLIMKKSSYGDSYYCAISNDINLKEYPLIKLEDGSVLNYEESKSWDDLYLNTGIISSNLTSDKCVRFVYSQIFEIKEYSDGLDTARNALSKLKNYSLPSSEYINLLKILIQGVKNKTISSDEIANIPFLRTYSVSKHTIELKEPKLVKIPYIKKCDINLYKLFKNANVDVFLLTEDEHKSFNFEDFKLLGCTEGFYQDISNASLILNLNFDTHDFYNSSNMYIKVDQSRADNPNFPAQRFYPEIEKVFKYVIDKEISAELMKVANYFQDSLKDYVEYSSTKNFSSNASYSGKEQIFSRLGLCLTNYKWVFDQQGNLVFPSEIQSDQVMRNLYGTNLNNVVANKLGFKNSIKNKIDEVSDFAKNIGLDCHIIADEDPEIMRQTQEFYNKLKQKKSTKKIKHNVKEELQKLNDGNQYFSNPIEDSELEYNPIHNPDSREKNVRDEVKEQKNNPKQTRYTRVTYKCNSNEKDFLRMEYNGKCQVCGTTIIGSNNKTVFSAVNVIRTNNLDDEGRKAEQIAWNSLCLCFNCSAKFKYCDLNMEGFVDFVKKQKIIKGSTDGFAFPFRLNNEKVMLNYSPKHMQNLKVAIDYYENKPSKDYELSDDEEGETIYG